MAGIFKALIVAGAIIWAAPAFAQDEEVIVTASRALIHSGDDDEAPVAPRPAPAMMLRRTADFAVQPVRVVGDTRDAVKRREEIYAMLKGAIELASKSGVELATGDYVVEPLTLANYKNLTLAEDNGRDDAEGAGFLIKTRLAPGMDSKTALERITRFIKAIPTVGRAEFEAQGDLTLSVVSPDQYRGQIIDLIAADAAKATVKFGPNYAVTVTGLDRPVEWTRAGLTEVSLYLPSAYSIVPAK